MNKRETDGTGWWHGPIATEGLLSVFVASYDSPHTFCGVEIASFVSARRGGYTVLAEVCDGLCLEQMERIEQPMRDLTAARALAASWVEDMRQRWGVEETEAAA